MTAPALTFDVSINRLWPGQKLRPRAEGETRWTKYNGGFRREHRTPDSLMAATAKGYSFTAVLGGCQGLCCGHWCAADEHKTLPGHCGRPYGYRANRHFLSAQFIALDFDTQDERSSIGFLAGLPPIARYGSFVYTTLSHRPEAPKARAVFVTDVPFSDPNTYRQAKRAVMAAMPWGDAGIHDPARFLYGTHPEYGETRYIGNILPLPVVDRLIERHRADLEAEDAKRETPRIPSSQVMGDTPAERYVSAAVQSEEAWVSGQVEGSGERHRGLLIAAMKLGSLRMSEWLPAELRASIDPYAVLLPAAAANGYIQKYGEPDARRTIGDGMAYATPRPEPESWNTPRPRVWREGGYPVAGVRL